jgi:hypothetical protein
MRVIKYGGCITFGHVWAVCHIRDGRHFLPRDIFVLSLNRSPQCPIAVGDQELGDEMDELIIPLSTVKVPVYGTSVP